MSGTIRLGGHTLELSRTDKVLFPDDGFTKGDLIEYYRFIAPLMVPLMKGHPLMLHRFPDGIGQFSFYQKAIAEHYPEWIHRVTVPKVGGVVVHVLCDNAATLVYLANQAVITPHLFLSRADRLDYPDRLVLDLDPSEDDVGTVRWAALTARDLLAGELGLQPWVMSTGSRGVHLSVPLDRKAEFDEVRHFAHQVAELLARRHPSRLTVEQRKNKREQRVFIDTLRNSYAATAVSPYAVRGRQGAPVATPLAWAEVEDSDFHPRRYDLKTIQTRPASELSPWATMPRAGASLKRAQQRLGEILQAELQPA